MQTLIYVNGGNVMSYYEYPIVEKVFSSPMVNYENLHLCGGWSWIYNGEMKQYNDMSYNELIIHRVLNNLKPLGEICGNEESITMLKDKCDRAGFITSITARENPNKHWTHDLRVANPKPLDDLFDFDALDADYVSYCQALGKKIIPNFDIMRGKTFAEFIDMEIDWGAPQGMHIVGLALGYPICSTVDRALMN
jgi:hypothetical protein